MPILGTIASSFDEPAILGLFGGGDTTSMSNVIDYITIATLGNAIDFGDLNTSLFDYASCSSSTRGLFAGGSTGTVGNVIDYVTILSTGNAIDFGDLTVARRTPSGCSNGHGGL